MTLWRRTMWSLVEFLNRPFARGCAMGMFVGLFVGTTFGVGALFAAAFGFVVIVSIVSWYDLLRVARGPRGGAAVEAGDPTAPLPLSSMEITETQVEILRCRRFILTHATDPEIVAQVADLMAKGFMCPRVWRGSELVLTKLGELCAESSGEN